MVVLMEHLQTLVRREWDEPRRERIEAAHHVLVEHVDVPACPVAEGMHFGARYLEPLFAGAGEARSITHIRPPLCLGDERS